MPNTESDPLLRRRLIRTKYFMHFAFNWLYPFLGIILITSAYLCQQVVNGYYSFAKPDFSFVFISVIVVGSIIVTYVFLRCLFSADKQNYVMATVVFPVMLVLQLIAGIYGAVQVADKGNYVLKEVQREMSKDFLDYSSYNEVKIRYDILQDDMMCCGVYGPDDYSGNQLPASCCPNKRMNEFCTDTKTKYTDGCANLVYYEMIRSVKIVSYLVISLSVIQICGAAPVFYILINMTGE